MADSHSFHIHIDSHSQNIIKDFHFQYIKQSNIHLYINIYIYIYLNINILCVFLLIYMCIYIGLRTIPCLYLHQGKVKIITKKYTDNQIKN